MRTLLCSLIFCGLTAILAAPDVQAQAVDYSLVGQPTYADRLDLSDQQRAEIATILDQRVQDLVAAPPDGRQDVLAKSDQALAAVLTEAQKESLQAMLESGKLQFNFHGEKWNAVLKWFAKQAGLSLVIDSEPPGDFTYSDTKEFTPTEAIDLLNSVLLSKNYTLIRREQMLILADTSDGIPFDLVPTVGVEDLVKRGRFEIVTVEFPLGSRPVADVVEAVTPLVGEHGRVTPMVAAKRLLVTETAGKQKAINVLIASIPEPTTPPTPAPPIPPVFANYPATGLDKEATEEMLTVLFPDAKVKFDSNAKVIHVQAVPNTQEGVKASIEKMVASVTGDNRARLQTYPVPADRLEDLVTQLTLAHPDLQISSDPTNGRLLVIANAADQAEVEKSLVKLDVATNSQSEPIKVVIYQLEEQSSDAVTTLLQSVLPRALIVSQSDRIAVRATEAEQLLAKSTIEQFTALSKTKPSLVFYEIEGPLSDDMLATLSSVVPNATLSQLDNEKRLSVVATEEDHELLAKTLTQIQDIQQPNERTLKIYDATDDQKSRLATITGSLPESISEMTFLPDVNPDEIAAWGTSDQHLVFEQLLTQLKTTPQPVIVEPQRVDLQIADPDALLATLREKHPKIDFVLNNQTDKLFYWAQAEGIEKIQADIQRLTSAMPVKQTQRLETYEIAASVSSNAVSILQSLAPNASVSIDPSNRRLVVVANDKDHTIAESVISKLGKQSVASDSVLIAYELKKGDAEAVVSLLSQVRPEANIVADTRSNRVLAAAPLNEQPALQALIAQLDAEQDNRDEIVVEAYPFRSLDPGTVLSVLEPLFPEMQLSVDQANHQIVASGTKLQQQKLATTITRVDGQGDEKQTRVEVYEVGAADPAQVQNILAQLVPTAVVSTNPEAGRVFVWADDASHKMIADAIEQFTQPSPDEARSLKTYAVDKSISESIVAILQPTVADAQLSLSDHTLIAWANEGDHVAIVEALDTLAKSLPKTDGKTVRVLENKTNVLSVAETLLPSLVPDAQILDASTANRWLIWADEENHGQVASLLQTLGQQLTNGKTERSVAVYKTENISSEAIQTMLSQRVPEAVILESQSDRIFVVANEDEHQSIKAIIAELSTAYQPTDVNVLMLHKVRDDIKSKVITYLETAIPQAIVVDSNTSGSISVWANAQQQTRVDDFIKQFQSQVAQPADRIVRVYPVDAERMAVAALIETLDAETTEGLSLQPNGQTNSLIARGNATEHEKLKAGIEAILSQLPESKALITNVYRFERGDPSAAVAVLQTLLPTASIAADTTAKVLVVTASPADQKRIATVVEQMQSSEPSANKATKIYRFDQASAESVSEAFGMLAPTARIGYDVGSNVVFATASAGDHEILQAAANEINGQTKGSVVKVYPLDRDKLAAETLIASLDETLKGQLNIQTNAATNSLIVRGDQEKHDQIQQAIDAIMTSLPDLPSTKTTVYPLELANSEVVAESLSDLAPEATIAADPGSNALLVTANEIDHQRISEVVEKLDVASGADLTVRVYPVKNADARRIYDSVSRAFELSRDYSITFQDATKSLYVIATPRNQSVFEKMFRELDQRPVGQVHRQQKIYMLENVDANIAQSTIRSSAWGQDPNPDIHHNQNNNSLVIFATEEQHKQFQTAIDQLEGDPRELEVFEVVANDPWVIEQAINGMFGTLPGSLKPSLSNDFSTGKLFVRATPSHLADIRKLLAKMGEPILDVEKTGTQGNTRTIRFPGDTKSIAKQIEAIWPRIRANRIQIVVPAQSGVIRTAPEQDAKEDAPRKNAPDENDEAQLRNIGPKGDEVLRGSNAAKLVIQNDSTRAPVPRQNADKKSNTDTDPEQENLPPVFLVPGESQITITSDDSAALDRLESLLRVMAANAGSNSGQSNFAVFLLRNMGAGETKLLLDQLFEDLIQRGLNDVVFVADERLNALIVHGSRHARDIIQELLETLDTADLPDRLDVYRPELITLEHAEASRIVEILENVYKTQLTSGGGRTPIAIPEGVSSSVASMLQQINAASAGPVLTLDIDETSNSLIVRAPPELRREISEFVDTIDVQASTHSNRHIKVIRLDRTKSDQMHDVLQQFLMRPGSAATSSSSSSRTK